MQFEPLDLNHLEQSSAGMAKIWNAACGPGLAISPDFIRYNLQPVDGLEQAGRLLKDGRQVLGFVIASQLHHHPEVEPETTTWIDAVAVHPDAQRRGYGSQLMAWAEDWLQKRGARKILLGGSLKTFAPSLPEELNPAFFLQRGYQVRSDAWDVARDLDDGQPIERHPLPEGADDRADDRAEVRPAGAADQADLLAFLEREFPGRWHFEAAQYLARGGSIGDFVICRMGARVEGFAWLTFPGSRRPLDRYYPQRLPKPWGQLGPIGVSHDLRGQGWGGLVLQTGLRALRAGGVRGCVIDWTRLLEFYGKYGFKPYRRYRMLSLHLKPID